MEGNPKHIQELLKTTGMESCKSVNTPMTAEDYKGRRFQEDRLPAQRVDSGRSEVVQKWPHQLNTIGKD